MDPAVRAKENCPEPAAVAVKVTVPDRAVGVSTTEDAESGTEPPLLPVNVTDTVRVCPVVS